MPRLYIGHMARGQTLFVTLVQSPGQLVHMSGAVATPVRSLTCDLWSVWCGASWYIIGVALGTVLIKA